MRKENVHHFMIPLIAINIFLIIAANFLMPLWASFVTHIGGDLRTAGIAICIFSIVIGFCTMLAGRIEHAVRKDEAFMVGTAIAYTIIYAGYFFVSHPWQLYLIQVLLGLCGAFQSPALFSLYARYMPKNHTAFHWGIWNGCYFIAIGVGSLISAFLAHELGMKAVFAVLFAMSFISMVLVFFIMPKIKKFNISEAIDFSK